MACYTSSHCIADAICGQTCVCVCAMCMSLQFFLLFNQDFFFILSFSVLLLSSYMQFWFIQVLKRLRIENFDALVQMIATNERQSH